MNLVLFEAHLERREGNVAHPITRYRFRVKCVVTGDASDASGWTFLTNHAHVLLCVARDPEVRIRTMAQRVGITERAAQRIISELVEAGYLTRHRLGRRNFYEVHPDRPLRHPLERDHQIGEILRVLARGSDASGVTVQQ